jgi:hypothetical protein
MNRFHRRLKIKELNKLYEIKNTQLNKQSAFLSALQTLPDEELNLLKENKHENSFVQMYYNTLNEQVTEVMRIKMAIETLSMKLPRQNKID